MSDITQFGADQNGCRSTQIVIGDLTILIRPMNSDANDRAVEAATHIADPIAAIAAQQTTINVLRRTLAEAEAERENLVAKLAATRRDVTRKPARLMGVGYARFDKGAIWILNGRERGFGEFGMRFTSWDDVFRTLDVRVTSHGTDEHGAWWAVENTGGAA